MMYTCALRNWNWEGQWQRTHGANQTSKYACTQSLQKYKTNLVHLFCCTISSMSIKISFSTLHKAEHFLYSKGKAREFQKNINFCFIDYAKAVDCVDHNKLWKILWELGIPDHLTCLLRNLCAGQEATIRTGHWTTDWFQIEKGVRQGCILLPCLFNFYAEYIMRNAGLEETQAGIKIAGRNINNVRYADDSTLMAESEEELKSLMIKVQEESEKAGLNWALRKLRPWHIVPSLHGK